MKRFRGGLVFKAHRIVHHSTLGARLIKKKKVRGACLQGAVDLIAERDPREIVDHVCVVYGAVARAGRDPHARHRRLAPPCGKFQVSGFGVDGLRLHVCTCIYLSIYLSIYLYLSVYVCMYVCMYVCINLKGLRFRRRSRPAVNRHSVKVCLLMQSETRMPRGV